MKRLLLLAAMVAPALCAQTATEVSLSISGQSQTLQTYALQNPVTPKVLTFGDPDEQEVANQLYIPKVRTNAGAPIVPSTVVAATSTMVNQTSNGTLPVTITNNYTGLGTGFNGTWTVQGVLPPDTTLAVGPTQIVQWVNVKMTVLNKATGLPVLGGPGFVDANQIWSSLGPSSTCATQNQGDPIVQYDRMADRWFLMQFAFTIGTATNGSGANYAAPPYKLCIAVSQTGDATAAYNLYEFNFTRLPDYPKLGIWPDGYYVMANDFSFSTVTGAASYQGTRYCAFNRAAMLAGSSSNLAVCFSGLDASHFGGLPADFEGTLAPPLNEAEFFISGDWFTKGPPYSMLIRRFVPNYLTPASSTLTDGFGGAPDSFVQIPFDGSVLGACNDAASTVSCVAQPGTAAQLDTLTLRPMYRLAYRNMGANRETLVFTQSVDPVGGAVAGLQFMEIRSPAANPPVVYNNVALNPDATNRWMGTAASDKLGNIGIGYSVSSAAVNPGIRITGRLRNDLKNFLRGEMNVTTGAGSQTFSVARWGDYSTMQIDPVDNCTFWFTTEYMANTSAVDWATKIIGFKFAGCQ